MNLKDFRELPEAIKRGGIIGALTLFLLGLCGFSYLPKIKELRRIQVEINRVEKEVEKAQRIERGVQPPSPEEERRWKEVESRLYSMIPGGKDIFQLTYELARLAKEYNILDISFKSGGEINPPAGQKEAPSESLSQAQRTLGKDLDHLLVKLFFQADYRDLAYFLAESPDIGRFLEIESVMIKRDFPLISVEMRVKAYYNQVSKDKNQGSGA